MVVVGPLVGVGVYDVTQRHNTILRNFPVLGHLRYFFEFISPEIQQYFIERHTDGMPLSKNQRNLVDARADGRPATHPFGTEHDLYAPSYEGLRHTMYPVDPPTLPRVRVGGPGCSQPYEASLFNISAMSFGALSSNAIRAMSHGAAQGDFYLNTGEGGLSDHHLAGGGDVVWQIGTAYFGCRTRDGDFDPDAFRERATLPNVKMIELKLSQGAKPGHGGVLPAAKNSEEIAKIRLIEPGTVVRSPPGHRTFSDAEGMLRFVDRLRTLADGKPVGIKLCLGREAEFAELCEAMKRLDLYPDFVTVDGAEGGTGAAPLEFPDAVGIPLEPALSAVDRLLREHGVRDRVRVIASGKILTAVSLLRALCYGADLCNAARAFMLAVGCIQAQRCDTNSCPTGVATQRPDLVKGLVVEQKKDRVTNYHAATLEALRDLLAACGVDDLADLRPDLFLEPNHWRHGRGAT
ncbi:MAG: FMN-binding glutamate synthase family protein [Myxococcales bacterium]|nr:FMN-binding glutamate synthase family protein [Myxococcales bacterium]